jgi:trigger factor
MATAELISRENNLARIKATVSTAEVSKHYKRVIREFAKSLDIPGFRKGKIPENVVRQRVGADSIASTVGDELKRYVVSKALQELKLTPRHGTTRWHTEAEPRSDEMGEYEFSVPVLPVVTLPDYRAFELTVPVLAVTDEMKKTYIKRLRQRFTEYRTKSGAAGQGDALRIGFTTVLSGSQEPSPLAAKDLLYLIGQEGNFPGWDEQLTGSEAGSSLAFDFSVPNDFADPRVAGKDVRVSIEVESVHEVKQPEIDAQFVKEHLNLGSVEQLDEYIEMMLTRERDQQVLQMKSELVMQRVVDQLEAEISDDMVNDELDGLIKEYDRRISEQGGTLDGFLQQKGMSLQEYRQELRPSAVQKIKRFLAVKAVAEAEQLEVTSEDYRRFAVYLLQHEGIPPDKLKELMDQPDFVREAAYQILREKALLHLAESASFTETDAGTAVGGAEHGDESSDEPHDQEAGP